jgi:uncharacterized membrane protein
VSDAAPIRDPLATGARASDLERLRGTLPDAVLERAAARLAAPPPVDQWRAALSLGLALLGATLLGAAVIHAVAFNWQAMGHAVRLCLPLVAMTGCALAGWRLGMERLGGVILLSLACLLAGAALLVHGQTYQTGAHAWQLFATWAVLIAPWVWVARFAPLALPWVFLVNVAFGAFWESHDFLGLRTREVVGTSITTLANAALLLAWERWGERFLRAGDGRWGPRVLGLMAVVPVTFATWWSLLETDRQALLLTISGLTLGALLLAMHHAYRRVRPDLFQLTVVAFSVVSCLTVGGARVIFRLTSIGDGGVLLMAVWVVALVGGAATWLRARHREISA